MTRTFITIDNETKFQMIKNIFANDDAAELEEFIDGSRHQLSVSCNSFSAAGKATERNIKRVEDLYSNDVDVEIWNN